MEGNQLRSIREKLGWTQEQMASELRVAANTIARLERGERGISESTALLIRKPTQNDSRKNEANSYLSAPYAPHLSDLRDRVCRRHSWDFL